MSRRKFVSTAAQVPEVLLSWQHITNPRKAKGHQDLVVNNPLSQDEGVSESLCAVSPLFIIETVTRCSWRFTDALAEFQVLFASNRVHFLLERFPCSCVNLKQFF